MRADLTEIVVVMDRSGSMSSCRSDAEGGLNEFIRKQKKEKGYANFTLVQFDDVYEIPYNGVDIREVGQITLEPRGMTALLDAVGKAINETGKRLADMPERDRPATVIFIIITDGCENASREFKSKQVKQMIETQENVFSWKFTYLGADVNAFDEAQKLGLTTKAVSNYSKSKSLETFSALSGLTSRTRMSSINGENLDFTYNSEELKSMSES